MDLPEILDTYLPRHWKPEGLSGGWTAVLWLAAILSEGDHRKVAVETSGAGMKQTLSQVSGQGIRVLDVSDDRLAHVLKHLSQSMSWHPIEPALHEHRLSVYDLPTEVTRCEATTVSAGHDVVDGGLVQFGPSKDDPSRPQSNIMTASLDPLGLPLATNGLSGEQADDGFSIPLLDRVIKGLDKSGRRLQEEGVGHPDRPGRPAALLPLALAPHRCDGPADAAVDQPGPRQSPDG